MMIENIPPELYEAFSQKEIGYSILIKGNAGVGKSTFALSLLAIFAEFEPIYISTRVAPRSVYSQFPWIKDQLKEENILDATRTYLPPIGSPKELKTHILRTIRFSDTPEFLKILYDKVEKNSRTGISTIVVIDSWDAITGLSGQKSEEWETVLTEFVRQMNIKLILISEHTTNSFLDYTVDGIITLKDNDTDDRILREMEINKIRSIERRQKRYYFTLYNNEFKYSKSYVENRYDFNGLANGNISGGWWKPIESNNRNLYSLGNTEIDKLYLGGLKSSSLNLWEIESDVPLSAFSNIMIPLVCNFISKGFGTIIYSIDGLNSRFIDKNKLFIHLNMEQISKNVRYLVEELPYEKKNISADIRPYVVPFSFKNFENTFTDIYNELAEKSSFKPVLSVVSYDFLTLQDSSFYSREIHNHLKFVRNYNVIEIGIVNQMMGGLPSQNRGGFEKDVIKEISYFFDTHMKMVFRNNAIFVYGIKPYSGMYWLNFEYSSKSPLPNIKLVPMV